MLFLIKNSFPHILLLLIVNNIYLYINSKKWEGLKVCRLLKEKKKPHCMYDNRNKWLSGKKINCKPRNYLYIHNKKKICIHESYKFNKYKLCSIFSLFDKKNDEKKGKKKDTHEGKSIVGGYTQKNNENKKEMNKAGKETDNAAPISVVNIPEKSTKHGNLLPTSDQTINFKENLKTEKISPKDFNTKKNISPCIGMEKGHDKEIKIEIKDTMKSVYPKDALKNVEEYKKHLQMIKDKIILSIHNIFSSYRKCIDKKDNLKNFVLNLLNEFEHKYEEYTYIKDIKNMNKEKVKEEYLQSNYNCFLEIVNIIEENLFNLFVYKIQSVKVKALNEIKEAIMSHRESNNDYISYINHVSKTFRNYEKKLKNLLVPSFKFTLYDKIRENETNVNNSSCLINFMYVLPVEKYEKLIKKNINYVKKLSYDLTRKKKKKFMKEIERNKNYQNILQIIDNQQKQIEILQDQLEANVEGINGNYSPFHCALAYRIPDTNLNISTQYMKGKFNIKLNCIPDDSLHLLGSYGFVKALPFGNLGLSFSLNF